MNKQLTELWFERIGEGLKWRKDEGHSDDWQLAYNYFRNRYPPRVESENLVFSLGVQSVEESVPERPAIVVSPLQPQYAAAALVLQQVLNELFVLLRVSAELEDATLDSFLYGVHVLKLGYDSMYGFKPSLGGLPQISSDGKQRIEFSGKVSAGMPWCKRLAPWNLVVPPGTVDVEDAPWVAVRVIRYLEDVRKDPKYDAGARRALKASPMEKPGREPLLLEAAVPEGRRDEMVALWEIRDRRNGKVIVIAEGNEGLVLRNEDDLLCDVLGGYPLVAQSANRNGRCFWSDGDFRQIKHHQEVINNLLTQVNEHGRATIARHLLNQDLIEEADLKALLSGVPNAVIRTKRGQHIENLDQVFRTWIPQFPSELVALLETIRRSANLVLGFSHTTLGALAGPPRRTAKEVAVFESAHYRRVGRRAKLNRRCLEELARKFAKMIFAFWREPQVIKVAGPGGLQTWVMFRGNELAAEYRFEYAAEDKLPETSVVREQKMNALVQALPMLVQMGVDSQYVLKAFLKYFPELDPEKALAQQQVPQNVVSLGELQEQLGNASV